MTDEKQRELLADSIAQATRVSLDFTLNPTRIAPKLRFDMDSPTPKTEVAQSPAVSPTGTPIINPKLVPWIAVAMGALATAAQQVPSFTIGGKILAILVPVASVVAGVFSPGLRKQP